MLADDLQGLIFATSNLRYLRGLSMLPAGLFMVLFSCLYQVSGGNPYVAAFVFLAALGAGAWASWRINRYYDCQYGKVEPGNWKGFPSLGLAVWGGIFGVLITIRPPGQPIQALWIAAFFWGIYMSSSGYRWFYLLLAAAFAILAPYWSAIGDWRTAALGISFVVAGIMDHLLLRRLLPGERKEEAGLSVV